MKIESNNVRYDRIITEAQHCAYRLSELKHLMSSPFLECEEMDKLIADVSECESKICEVGISIAMIKERLSQMERELITILYGPPPVFSDEEQKKQIDQIPLDTPDPPEKKVPDGWDITIWDEQGW